MATESPSDTTAPPNAALVDAKGHRWTLDPQGRVLRDGVVVSTGPTVWPVRALDNPWTADFARDFGPERAFAGRAALRAAASIEQSGKVSVAALLAAQAALEPSITIMAGAKAILRGSGALRSGTVSPSQPIGAWLAATARLKAAAKRVKHRKLYADEP